MAQRHVVPQNIEDMVQVGHISDACFDINSDDAEVVYFNTIEGVEIEDPILTKIIWPGPRGTLVEHWMKKGQVIPFHRHHSEFLNLLVKGQVKVTLAGKQYTAGQYDSWTAVPGVDHSIEALEDSMIMEFSDLPGGSYAEGLLPLLVKGQVKVTLAGKHTAGQYDSWTAVPGVDHSIEALEDSMIMEFFYPAAVMQLGHGPACYDSPICQGGRRKTYAFAVGRGDGRKVRRQRHRSQDADSRPERAAPLGQM